jgi:uncharacterized protein (TIGR00106 family)
MKVMIDLCVCPFGVGLSVSPYIAECEKIIRTAGLSSQLHPYGTVIEGDWDDVFKVVRQCHEKMHEMDSPRVLTILKVGTRNDKDQTMQDKIDSVEKKLAEDNHND